MNAALAALHSVDAAAVGLADFGRPGDYFARQVVAMVGSVPGVRDAAHPGHGPL